MTTWKELPQNSDFSVTNIPFGIFSTMRRTKRVGVAIGDEIIDLSALCKVGMLEDIDIDPHVFDQPALNDFIGQGKEITQQVRKHVQHLLSSNDSPLKDYPNLFVQQANADMHLPVEITDYTDFYSSLEHATNVGKMFRDPKNALLPNWKHLPVGYHGRASSIVVSGTDFHRPKGQIINNKDQPEFSSTQKLDFELELGFIVGKNSTLGQRINVNDAQDYIFGYILVNDWSARDIQKWEYIPLGPFLGKNFATSISPWIVTTEALLPFEVKAPVQEPPPLSYLFVKDRTNLDIELEVALRVRQENDETILSKSNSRYLYWNCLQQLAHHTVNGCNINVGDLMASGTISGPSSDSYGSMLELSWGGKDPIVLKNGEMRTFLEDDDEIIMRAHAGQADQRVGFGEVRGRILPPCD